MQITLNEDEIKEAIEAAVRKQITIAANQNIEVKLTAGRGENGHTATLEISAARLVHNDEVTQRQTIAERPAMVLQQNNPAAELINVAATIKPELAANEAPAAFKPPSKFRALKPVTQVADVTDVVDPAAGVEDELVSSDPVADTATTQSVEGLTQAEIEEAANTLADVVDVGLPEAQPEPEPVQVIRPARTSIFNVQATK